MQVTSSPQVAQVLTEQLDLAQRGSRQIGKLVTWVFVISFVIMLAIFALVYFALLR